MIIQVKVKFASSSAIFGECRLHSITRIAWGYMVDEAHTVDALAVRGDERRGSLRKLRGVGKQTLIPEISEWELHLG